MGIEVLVLIRFLKLDLEKLEGSQKMGVVKGTSPPSREENAGRPK